MIETENIASFKFHLQIRMQYKCFGFYFQNQSAAILDFAFNLLYAAQVVGLINHCSSF